MGGFHFEASHTVHGVGLTLFDSFQCVVWHTDMERYKAQEFVDALYRGCTLDMIRVEEFVVCMVNESVGTVILISDNSPYLSYKILLTRDQAKELASTIAMHIVASEVDGRPKDPLTPLDDAMNQGWSPDGERRQFGSQDSDDTDDADWWKKGGK